jgi:hypothetical protein
MNAPWAAVSAILNESRNIGQKKMIPVLCTIFEAESAGIGRELQKQLRQSALGTIATTITNG